MRAICRSTAPIGSMIWSTHAPSSIASTSSGTPFPATTTSATTLRAAPADDAVDSIRARRWLDVVGPDHWALEIDGWMLLAINAQLLDSGLDAEAEQWRWLEDCLAARGEHDRTVLVTHKPLIAPDAETATAPAYRFVPPIARRRLVDLLDAHRVALVVSGHVHQFRSLDLVGLHHLWAPTTWAVLPDDVQPTFGSKRCGMVSLELGDDGSAHHELIEPSGMTQITLRRDIPSPYAH